MGLSTWSKGGSEKAQSSQTIRILMKTMQFLAEDATNEDISARSFTNIASAVIQNLFKPSGKFSVNEQVQVLFNAMGWKNAQIKLISANEATILLGSNRHLDQDPNSVRGLTLLVGAICKALGFHILGRDIDAFVSIDIHTGPTYNIGLKAIQGRKTEEKKPKPKPIMRKTQTTIPKKIQPSSSSTTLLSPIDTSQIFLPVLSNKLPSSRLHLILQDVLVEFCQSWHQHNPLEEHGTSDERENVIILITFLVQQALDNNNPIVDAGSRLGSFFGHAIIQNFGQDENLMTQELIDSSEIGSMIRDIKARAFCSLSPGEKCGPNIGDHNRAICDFCMGLWSGCLTELGDKEYKFTGFYAAGKRDPYCLMEFSAN